MATALKLYLASADAWAVDEPTPGAIVRLGARTSGGTEGWHTFGTTPPSSGEPAFGTHAILWNGTPGQFASGRWDFSRYTPDARPSGDWHLRVGYRSSTGAYTQVGSDGVNATTPRATLPAFTVPPGAVLAVEIYLDGYFETPSPYAELGPSSYLTTPAFTPRVPVPLTGTSRSTSGGSAALRVPVGLSGTTGSGSGGSGSMAAISISYSGASATLQVPIALAGTSSSSSTGSVAFLPTGLHGGSVSTSTGSASLTCPVLLAGVSSSHSGGSAALSVPTALAGSSRSSSSGTGVLYTPGALEGHSTSTSGGTGALTVTYPVPLGGISVSGSGAGAVLSVPVALYGTATGSSFGAASSAVLLTPIALGGHSLSTSSGSAILTGHFAAQLGGESTSTSSGVASMTARTEALPVPVPVSTTTPGGTTIGNTPARHSAIIVSEYIVLRTGAPVGKLTTPLPGAYVTFDTTAETMGSLNLTCLDPTRLLMPTAAGGGLLEPTGVEIQVRMGFQIGNTPPVMWTQGIFVVTQDATSTAAATIDSGGGLYPGPGPNITVTAYDRSKRISLALFDQPFTIAAGTPVGEAIEQILAAQAPWVKNPNISPSTYEVAQQVFSVGTDPWQAIVQLAAAASMVAYFDLQGVLVVRPAPSNAGAPTALQIVDGPTNTAMSVTNVVSATPGYNGVLVVSSSAGATTGYSGAAYTSDPDSPLYYLGPYGRRPCPPVTVSTATSDAQCEAIAQALLSQYLGLSKSVVMDIIPCPFLAPYDLVFVKNQATDTTAVYIVQQITRYLDYSEQETVTGVPIGSPISQLAWLSSPSDALYGELNAYAGGAGAYTWTPTTGFIYSSYTGNFFGGSGFGGSGAFDLLGGGLFGAGGALGVLWGGGMLWNLLRGGWGGSSDEEDIAEDAGDDAIDVLEDL